MLSAWKAPIVLVVGTERRPGRFWGDAHDAHNERWSRIHAPGVPCLCGHQAVCSVTQRAGLRSHALWRRLAAAATLSATSAWAQVQPPAAVPDSSPRTPAVVPTTGELGPPRLQPSLQPNLQPSPQPGSPANDATDPRALPHQRAATAAAARELGKPAEELRLDVKAYSVDNKAPAELRAALPRLTAAFVGAGKGFEDLAGAAAEVTRYLQRELGYYLAYAYVPEQDAAGGVIQLAVLEGRLDRVELNWREGLPVDREVVQAYLDRLPRGEVLKVRDIERVVFLLNDLRGLTARFELRPGSTPGTATLVVTPSAEKRTTGKLETDANGTQALGLYRVSGLLQVNSPLGRGDGLTLNALASSTGGLAFALVGYNTPLGSDGFKLGASLSGVKYQLDKTAFPLDLHGTAATANIYGLYPVVRARNLNLFTLLSLEHKSYDDRNINSAAKRSVQVATWGATGDFRDGLLGGAVNTYELNLVSGQVKPLQGSTPSLEDDARFTKLTCAYSRLQDLVTGRALLYFSLRGQQAANNLDTTEQFRLGGPDAVRAFASGEGTGDSGVVGSLELRWLPPEEWLGRLAREFVFSVFADTGYVQYRYRPRAGNQPSAEANHVLLSGAGVGMAWVRAGEYSLRLSVAQATGGNVRGAAEKPRARVYLQAAMLFN